jgi:hypothetical protein
MFEVGSTVERFDDDGQLSARGLHWRQQDATIMWVLTGIAGSCWGVCLDCLEFASWTQAGSAVVVAAALFAVGGLAFWQVWGAVPIRDRAVVFCHDHFETPYGTAEHPRAQRIAIAAQDVKNIEVREGRFGISCVWLIATHRRRIRLVDCVDPDLARYVAYCLRGSVRELHDGNDSENHVPTS